MISEGVGEYEADDIRKIVARILNDLGNPEPPLNLAQVRALLDLNIGYYSTANTTLLQDVAARMKVAGKQVLQRPMLLVEAVTKARRWLRPHELCRNGAEGQVRLAGLCQRLHRAS